MKDIYVLLVCVLLSASSIFTYSQPLYADNVSPVRGNNNGSSFIDDAKITLQVKSALAVEKGIPSGRISVETSKGVVFLKGTLAAKEQASTAIEVVASIPGVKDVNTYELEVYGSEHPLADAYITAKVKGIYLRERLFGGKESASMAVKVETKNGVVYLSGNVDKKEVERNAINLAKQVEGVKEVISSIKS